MATYKTEDLLNLCRAGVPLMNTAVAQAVSELSSYIVFASLLDYDTELPEELESRVVFLRGVQNDPASYPQDIFPVDEEEFVEVLEDPEPPRTA